MITGDARWAIPTALSEMLNPRGSNAPFSVTITTGSAAIAVVFAVRGGATTYWEDDRMRLTVVGIFLLGLILSAPAAALAQAGPGVFLDTVDVRVVNLEVIVSDHVGEGSPAVGAWP